MLCRFEEEVVLVFSKIFSFSFCEIYIDFCFYGVVLLCFFRNSFFINFIRYFYFFYVVLDRFVFFVIKMFVLEE